MAGCTTSCTSRSCSGLGSGANVQEARSSGFARQVPKGVTMGLVGQLLAGGSKMGRRGGGVAVAGAESAEWLWHQRRDVLPRTWVTRSGLWARRTGRSPVPCVDELRWAT